MAVNSCNSFDETTSWRSEEDVINMTKSAAAAVDFLANEKLVENFNMNNSNNKKLFLKSSTVESNFDLNSNANDIDTEKDHPVEKTMTNDIEIKIVQNFSEIGEHDLTLKQSEKKLNGEVNNTNKLETEKENLKSESSCKKLHEVIEHGLLSKTKTQLNIHSTTLCNGELEKQSVANEDKDVHDPEVVEERFRVDRRKLEQMLQADNGSGQSGEDFFSKVMVESNTQITWPSKLKIGAKSKKDPHIKVTGKQDDVKKARDMVMRVLDTRCTKCTLKMDVSHTEHSHVIGKGGNNIKRVMEDTECHIHFPDSNRNSTAEKSNQVSIAGQPSGVERAMNKIRELLPIVVSFDLSVSGSVPDPNSPPIQLIVQTYNISVQFKQRLKVYCTTACTVRGSKDNAAGIIEGTIKLMQHLPGGQISRVTSQLEVAQQQHAYMLGRNACNVKQIMQKTGAQINFPDPTSIPKKNTIFISGSVEQVVLARERLMGCLPLVLMFDMKQDDASSNTDEAVQINRLMDALDVFISVKAKPKQPSKSVIVKSIERNIYNMFEARRQLLKLASNGLKTPPRSTSPTPIALSTPSNISVRPVIRLPQSQSSLIKPQFINIIPPNGVTLVNGSMSSLTPAATSSGPNVIRPNWPHNPMPSPSQNSYPLSQQATIAAIQAQQQQSLVQAQINAQQMAALVSASQPATVVNSPNPISGKSDEFPVLSADPLQVTKRLIHENKIARFNGQSPTKAPPLGNQSGSALEGVNFSRKPQVDSEFSGKWPNDAELPSSLNTVDSENVSGSVRSLQRHVLELQNQLGRQSANSSFNKGSGSEKRLTNPHGFTDSIVAREELPTAHLERLSLTEGIDQASKNLLQVSTNYKINVSRHSTPSGSDRNSPLASTDYQALPLEPELGKQMKLVRSPSSSSSSADLRTAIRQMHNSNRSKFLHPDHLQENQFGRFDNSFKSEKIDSEPKTEAFFKPDLTAPPPGFDNFPLSKHSPMSESTYETLRQKAYECMQKGPVASEVRTPTNCWYGQGFSRSMPSNEWNRTAGKKFKNRLDTNYERDDMSEVAESSTPSDNFLTMSQRLSGRAGSAFLSWREKNNPSASSHSKDISNPMPKRRQHSTFDPQPVEYSHPPPPHPNDDSNSPTPFDAPSGSCLQPISNKEAALSLLTNTHLGGQSNGIELHELLNHLNLQKYSEVFIKQEVDLQTFLTLTDNDLMELGISAFGPRKKILLAIEELKKNRNVLYEKSLNAAPGRPGSFRAQSTTSMTAFLQGQPRPESPTFHQRSGLPVPPSSRLLNGNHGMVSQSGRW